MLDTSEEKDIIARYVRGEDVRDAICAAATKVSDGGRLADVTPDDSGRLRAV